MGAYKTKHVAFATQGMLFHRVESRRVQRLCGLVTTVWTRCTGMMCALTEPRTGTILRISDTNSFCCFDRDDGYLGLR